MMRRVRRPAVLLALLMVATSACGGASAPRAHSTPATRGDAHVAARRVRAQHDQLRRYGRRHRRAAEVHRQPPRRGRGAVPQERPVSRRRHAFHHQPQHADVRRPGRNDLRHDAGIARAIAMVDHGRGVHHLPPHDREGRKPPRRSRRKRLRPEAGEAARLPRGRHPRVRARPRHGHRHLRGLRIHRALRRGPRDQCVDPRLDVPAQRPAGHLTRGHDRRRSSNATSSPTAAAARSTSNRTARTSSCRRCSS